MKWISAFFLSGSWLLLSSLTSVSLYAVTATSADVPAAKNPPAIGTDGEYLLGPQDLM
jgi:hypothetical protein